LDRKFEDHVLLHMLNCPFLKFKAYALQFAFEKKINLYDYFGPTFKVFIA
jgi:hypothetical protein